jgi:type I restriction enzyme M protein
MISKMRSVKDGGSRIGIVMNGSPLFSGDAGSGLSEIRRWIIENDWLEAIVGLPDQLFYNTGIFTYIWIVTNRKRSERRGQVQLIDARDLYRKMKKSLGNKRNELDHEHIAEITHLYESFTEGDLSKILPNEFFGFRKVTVEQPLRVRYDVTEETLGLLDESTPYNKLADEVRGVLTSGLQDLLGESFPTRDALETTLVPLLKKAGKVPAPAKKAVIAALTVRDPDADPIVGEPDAMLRDTENVPLTESVEGFVAREVLPVAPDAWVDDTKTKVGYEIPFTRQFYKYVPPRPLAEIDGEIKAGQQRILELLSEVTE